MTYLTLLPSNIFCSDITKICVVNDSTYDITATVEGDVRYKFEHIS
jgi:hypothetical protein